MADGGIESQNTVGYTTTSITGTDAGGNTKWYQVAIQFKGTAETTDRISVVDAISTSGLTAETWRNKVSRGGPMIQVWNGSGYDYYYYISDAYPTAEDKANKTNAQTGWANGSQLLATANYLNVGDGFWFTAKNLGTEAGSIVVAGAVSEATSKTVNVGASGEWSVVANPFPVAVPIKDIACTFTPSTWRNKTKTDGTGAAIIEIYNGSGYTYYYYITDAYPTAADKSAKTNAQTGWANGSQLLATETLDVGQACWVKTTGLSAGTFTFSMPSAE